jgi:hypothetical protein
MLKDTTIALKRQWAALRQGPVCESLFKDNMRHVLSKKQLATCGGWR